MVHPRNRLTKKSLSVVNNSPTAIFFCNLIAVGVLNPIVIGIEKIFSIFQINIFTQFQIRINSVEFIRNIEFLQRLQYNVTSEIRNPKTLYIPQSSQNIFQGMAATIQIHRIFMQFLISCGWKFPFKVSADRFH